MPILFKSRADPTINIITEKLSPEYNLHTVLKVIWKWITWNTLLIHIDKEEVLPLVSHRLNLIHISTIYVTMRLFVSPLLITWTYAYVLSHKLEWKSNQCVH